MKNNPYIYRVDEGDRVWFINSISKVIVLLLIIFFGAYPSYAMQIGLSGLISDNVTEPEDTTEVVVKDLEEYTVTANLRARKGSKETFVFSKEDKKKSRNVGELLGCLSMLRFSESSENLEYMYSGKIKYMVDSIPREKDEVLGLLRSNPGQFHKVDVITNPGGLYHEYDLLINLHRSKYYRGVDVVFGDRTEVTPTKYYGDGNNFVTQNEFVVLSLIRDRFDFSAELTSFWGRTASSFSRKREFPLMNIVREWHTSPRDKPYNTGISRNVAALIRAGYSFNKNHRISVLFQNFFISSNKYGKEKFWETRFNPEDESQNSSSLDMTKLTTSKDPVSGSLSLNYIGQINGWHYRTSAIGVLNNNILDVDYLYLPDNQYLSSYKENQRRMIFDVESNKNFLEGSLFLSLGCNYNIEYIKTLDKKSDYVFRNKIGNGLFFGRLDYYMRNSLFFGMTFGANFGHNSDYDYFKSYIKPKISFKSGWGTSSKVYLMVSYDLGTVEPTASQLVERLVTEGDLIMRNGNSRLKPSLLHNVHLSATFLNSINMQFDYYNQKNSIFINARQIPQQESPTGKSFIMLFPDNEHEEFVNFNLSYGNTFFNHFEVSAVGVVSYMYAKYGDISRRSCQLFTALDLGYVGFDGSTRVKLSYQYGGISPITAIKSAKCRQDSMTLHISKRLLKNRNLNLFLLYTLPVHFGNNVFTSTISTDSYVDQIHLENYFRKDNSILIGVDYYFHKGDKMKQFNDRRYNK